MNKNHSNRGLSLLITLVTMSVLLGVSASLLNITLKQYLLSGIALQSEQAYQAAAAGIECSVYFDVQTDMFDVPGNGSEQSSRPSLSCFGLPLVSASLIDSDADGQMRSGEKQRFRFSWYNSAVASAQNEVCTEIDVYKFKEDADTDGDAIGPDMRDALRANATVRCPEGTKDPVSGIESPVECTVIQSRGYNVPCTQVGTSRTVERELIQRY